MSDTSKVWIALDREDAEHWSTEEFAVDRNVRLSEACRKSLVTECCEVGGEVWKSGDGPRLSVSDALLRSNIPADFSTGPCRVIVIAGERDG